MYDIGQSGQKIGATGTSVSASYEDAVYKDHRRTSLAPPLPGSQAKNALNFGYQSDYKKVSLQNPHVSPPRKSEAQYPEFEHLQESIAGKAEPFASKRTVRESDDWRHDILDVSDITAKPKPEHQRIRTNRPSHFNTDDIDGAQVTTRRLELAENSEEVPHELIKYRRKVNPLNPTYGSSVDQPDNYFRSNKSYINPKFAKDKSLSLYNADIEGSGAGTVRVTDFDTRRVMEARPVNKTDDIPGTKSKYKMPQLDVGRATNYIDDIPGVRPQNFEQAHKLREMMAKNSARSQYPDVGIVPLLSSSGGAMSDRSHYRQQYARDKYATVQERVNKESDMAGMVNEKKVFRLRTIDPLILDTSLCDPMVGSVRGHSPSEKMAIMKHVLRCGLSHFVVGHFSSAITSAEQFVIDWKATGQEPDNLVAISPMFDKYNNGIPDNSIPVALRKIQGYGITNVILERSIMDKDTDWTRWSRESELEEWRLRLQWIRDNISPTAKVYICIRDFTTACAYKMTETLKTIRAIAMLGAGAGRPTGFILQDRSGDVMPSIVSSWIYQIKEEMRNMAWSNAHLILHVFKGYGMSSAVVMDALGSGATGIMAAICEEGASTGQVSSTNILFNLVKAGNNRVGAIYDINMFIQSARQVTNLVTGRPATNTTELYGNRAQGPTFFDGLRGNESFDIYQHNGARATNRINRYSSNQDIRSKLEEFFGRNEPYGYDESTLRAMRLQMEMDAHEGGKHSYNDITGLASLFERSTGTRTVKMDEELNMDKQMDYHKLIVGLQSHWNIFSGGRAAMPFNQFFDAFLARSLSNNNDSVATLAFANSDVVHMGEAHWSRFRAHAKTALRFYNRDINDVQSLLDVTVNRVIIPVIHSSIPRAPLVGRRAGNQTRA